MVIPLQNDNKNNKKHGPVYVLKKVVMNVFHDSGKM